MEDTKASMTILFLDTNILDVLLIILCVSTGSFIYIE